MSTGSHIPWNTKPKNGITSFFTEGTFNKWLSQDTHESRLEERLAKIGIKPPPRMTGPMFSCKPKSTLESKGRETIKKETDPCLIKDQGSVTVMGLCSEGHHASIKPEAKIKVELHPNNSQSEFSSTQTYKSSFNPVINTEAKTTPSCDLGNNVSDHMQYSDIDVTKAKEHIEVRNDSDVHTEETEEQVKEKHDSSLTGEHLADECEINMDMVAENVKPFSFYKEGTEEDYKVEESEEEDEDAVATIDETTEISNKIPHANEVTEGETVDTVESELTEEQLKELQAQKEEEERKAQTELNRKDKMFFNKKDRQATKYFPDIFNRKPKNRRSQLTCQEQKLYNDFVRCYGNLGDTPTEIFDENFKKYIALKVIVDREQELFQKYLKSISFSCKKDYAYIHPEVEKYAATRFMVKKQECFKYPRFYNSLDRFILTDDIPNPSPTLQYVRPLLQLGSVCKLVLPNIVQGLPQPCVTTNFNKINSICPIMKPIYKGTSVPVWNKVVCSKDANAEQLAVPNKCDVVMSSSSIRYLIDNQGKILKYWDMPFTVREYQVNEGEKTTVHKVVYIDKPFIRQSQYVPKDRIKLYQKHAIRALAIRTNVRGQVLCGIKPVHEMVKLPTLEEAEHEINLHEKAIEETTKKDDIFNGGGDEVGHADTNKRKRKHGKGGMFDLEKDIDDLETFGMDTFMSERSKVKVNSPEGKINMCTEKIEVGGKHAKKGRKSTEEDLEFLKNELKDIKTQAIKESAKHLEIHKDSHCTRDQTETQSFDMQKDEKTSDNNEKSDEMTVVEADVNQCAPNHDNGEVTDLKPDDDDVKNSILEDDNMEKEGKAIDETVSDNSGKILRNTRKTKKELLTVKNISSFSERLKQMSTIKSKLMHRNQGTDSASNLTIDKTRSRLKSIETMDTFSNANSNNVVIKPDNTGEKSKTLQKLSGNASDSDSDVEGLVIDVPSESPQIPSKNVNPKSPIMPRLEKISDTLMKEENQQVSSESEFGSPHLVIAIDEEESEEKPKGRKKRKSTGDIVLDVPKRTLRSSLSRESSDAAPAGNQTLESKKNESRRKSMIDNTNAGPATLKGGKKVENQPVSTRSRSVSFDNVAVELGTGPDKRRVTRRSTGSADPKEEEIVAHPVPSKRGRGRPRKNVINTERTAMEDDKSEDVSENSLVTTEKIPFESDICVIDEVGKIEKVDDSDNDEVISPVRNKAKVRRLDSDDESSNSSIDKLENITHSKQHSSSKKKDSKKELSELEARKIKEMAAALKMKIAGKKSKAKEDDGTINEVGTASENVDVSNGSRNIPNKLEDKKEDHVRLESGKSTGCVPDKVGNKEEDHLRPDGDKSTGLDTGIDNILKLQDKMHGTGSTFKGSAVDVFKQKHGMTSCEFPVEDNVTYHQWNLSGSNILIRCKYHGFISGQGLVHISPKIEYQPNFGFEQDTVSEICKNWISIYIRPNSTLLKPRINPFNSEIMMFENKEFKDLIPPDSLFKPEQAFTDLKVILEKLKSLPVGQYLLKNDPRKDQFTIMKATEQEERGSFDLHLNHSSVMKCTTPSPVQWTPVNPNLMLPHQRKMNFIPCTFFPKDAKVGNKQSKHRPQKFMKKKKGKKNK